MASSSARNSSLRGTTRSRRPTTSIGRTLACASAANHGRTTQRDTRTTNDERCARRGDRRAWRPWAHRTDHARRTRGQRGARPHRGERRVSFRPLGHPARQLGIVVPDAARARGRRRGRGRPRRCAHVWDQPARIHAQDGSRLIGTLSLGSMATHTVVHGAQTVRVPDGVDLIEACLLGCGASTGIGAAVNTAGVTAGDTVAVIGLGGIGLSALIGSVLAGATRIIAIDRIAAKLDTALALGATDVIDAGVDDAVTAVRSLTDTGVDVAFEATGNAPVVAQAVAMLARGGTAVAIGVPAPDSTVSIPWGEASVGAAYPNKATLKITDGGDPVADDFVAWLDDVADRRLDLRPLVSVVAPF